MLYNNGSNEYINCDTHIQYCFIYIYIPCDSKQKHKECMFYIANVQKHHSLCTLIIKQASRIMVHHSE